MTIAGSPKLERMAQDADAKRRTGITTKIERCQTLARLALANGNITLAMHYNQKIKHLQSND